MKLHLLVLFLTSYFQYVDAQNVIICNCEAIVNPDFKGSIAIWDKPNGKILTNRKHNLREEDFLILTILKDSSSYFFVNMSNSLSPQKTTKGWIEKTKEIGTYSRNYRDTLKLYSKPNLEAKIQSKHAEWINEFFSVSKCNGKWVYVKIIYKGQSKEGWLQPNKQCPNPYTTCN